MISRVHRPLGVRPGLVHVDAYRLTDLAEVDDLDLDASLDDHVTVVEWGEGKAEQLTEHRLDVRIDRSTDPTDDTRTVTLTGIGDRWRGVDLTIDTTPEDIDD
jgi:tRNA threonylcarbamoyladenosine biosynthesis protein TsaE